jgi:hypothetical protein
MNLQALFQPKDKDKEVSEALKSLDLTADKARICLETDDFKHFKQMYEQTERATIEAMIAFTKSFVEGQGDISRYAMVMSRLATKLETVRHLVRTIETSAKRGMSERES